VLALLDPLDRHHAACASALPEAELPLYTSGAVLTEVFHFLPQKRQKLDGWRFFRSGMVRVLSVADEDFAELERLMLKYADRPMDFADATLVRLAEREGLDTILTVDRDFEIYRIGPKKRFRVLPKR
jgi:hypothetical protein